MRVDWRRHRTYRPNTMNIYRASTIIAGEFSSGDSRSATARAVIMRAVLVGACALAVACSKDEGLVRIDGSSTVFPIMSAVSVEFQKADLTRVAVGVSGTIAGFR